MLRKVLNVNALDKMRNEDLYGDLPPISQVIQTRRLKLAGHVFRDKTSPAHLTVTWDPPHGKMNRGKPANTFIDTLLRDTGLDSPADLENAWETRNCGVVTNPVISPQADLDQSI